MLIIEYFLKQFSVQILNQSLGVSPIHRETIWGTIHICIEYPSKAQVSLKEVGCNVGENLWLEKCWKVTYCHYNKTLSLSFLQINEKGL